MNGGAYHQSGGFDPGLSALIAALLTGSVSAYGYSKDSRTTEEKVAESLKTEYEQRLKRAEAKDVQAAVLAAEKAELQRKLQALEIESSKFKKKLEAAEGSYGPVKEAETAFQLASTQALKDAIPKVIRALVAKNPLLDKTDTIAKLTEVLEYPTTYQAKLARLTLPVFYEKRVRPVLTAAVNATGGRRRKRRGGGRPLDDALNLYVQLLDRAANNPSAKTEADLTRARNVLAKHDEGQKLIIEREPKAAVALGIMPGYSVPEEPDYELLSALGGPPPAVPLGPAAAAAAAAGPGPVEPSPLSEEAIRAATVPGTPGPGSPASYGSSSVPSYEEFAKMYADAIREATTSVAAQVAQRSAEVRKSVDEKAIVRADAAAVKAAGVLADKIEKAMNSAESDIASQTGITSILSPARRTALQVERQGLEGMITMLRDRIATLRKGISAAAWPNEKTMTEGRLNEFVPLVKEYLEKVKAAQKEETTSLTDTGRRALFKTNFTLSVGNPFAAAWKAATDPSKAYTDAQKTAKFRAMSQNTIKFIKKIFDNVAPILAELEKVKLRKKKGGSRRRGGAGLETAEEKCATVIRINKLYNQGDPDFLIKSLRAVAYGGTEPVDGSIWVTGAVEDQTPASAKKSSLLYLLDRLDTGVFTTTSDYLLGIVGNAPTYTETDAVLAGEAYVLLRCYLEKAAEVVKALKGSETVFQNLSLGLSEAKAATTAVNKASGTVESRLMTSENAVRARESTISQMSAELSREVGDRLSGITDKGALEGQLNDLARASALLRKLRFALEQFKTTSESLFVGKNDPEIVKSEFENLERDYEAQANPVFASVDEILEGARRLATSYKAVAPRLAAAIGIAEGPGPVESNIVPDVINPIGNVSETASTTGTEPKSVQNSPVLGPAAAAAAPEAAPIGEVVEEPSIAPGGPPIQRLILPPRAEGPNIVSKFYDTKTEAAREAQKALGVPHVPTIARGMSMSAIGTGVTPVGGRRKSRRKSRKVRKSTLKKRRGGK